MSSPNETKCLEKKSIIEIWGTIIFFRYAEDYDLNKDGAERQDNQEILGWSKPKVQRIVSLTEWSSG